MKKRIVIFDFDKTLTHKDTILGFFLFSARKGLLFPFKVMLYAAAMVCTKLKLMSTRNLKAIGVKLFLANMERAQLEACARQYARRIGYNDVFRKEYQLVLTEQDATVLIISASFVEYLKYIFPEETIIASTLAYKDERVCGIAFECYGEKKVEELDKRNIDRIDIFYTDSFSDAPLARKASQIYLVKNGASLECADYNDFVAKAR
jgi:phosphoserine phosphatase